MPQPARAPKHEHLRDVAAVRLVLGLGQDDLHRADDAGLVLGDEQHALAELDFGGDAAPERERPGHRQRLHEADRRTAVDAVDQQLGERLELLGADRRQTANDGRGGGRSGRHVVRGERRGDVR